MFIDWEIMWMPLLIWSMVINIMIWMGYESEFILRCYVFYPILVMVIYFIILKIGSYYYDKKVEQG